MQNPLYNTDEILTCRNCITGKTEEVMLRDGNLVSIHEKKSQDDNCMYIGPGLTDLQINGINGIDFNNASLTVQEIIEATHYLLSNGITVFFPTVITNSEENILKIVDTIKEACLLNRMVRDCISGIHLEGPFISPAAGAKGAHDEKYIRAPDWELFNKYRQASGDTIKLVTIAPEWEGSYSFIEQCRAHHILVSIGHSMADSEQVGLAVSAGARLSTHLGNGVPLLLARHPNIIWDQLAAEELYACIITDGIHIPESFIKVVIKNKGDATILVSDATCFAGLPPGEYESHIGGTVILDDAKRISLKSSPGLLAGSATSLLGNVEYLVGKNISTLGEAWKMASANVAKMLLKNDTSFNNKNDKVIFQLLANEIIIKKVIKNGRVVFEK